jgi:hypothetical protein
MKIGKAAAETHGMLHEAYGSEGLRKIMTCE